MTTAGSSHVIAAIYCRISISALNDTTKVEEQEQQCREVCRRRGWEIGEVYADNSRSAWHRDRKRPGWDAMLEAIRAGRFGAIVTYWGDRLVRQPRDLEDLLDLRDVRQITLASVAGQYDFGNPDHRMMMRWEVARACNESDTISRRMKNHLAARRAQGLSRPGGRGGRAFGFATDGFTHVPAEADAVREAAERVLTGEPVGAICRDLSDRGIRTPAGLALSHGTMRKVLANPRYAGLMPDGEHQAAWEPVLDRDMWEAVRAVLDAKTATFAYTTNVRKYLLSGIARCSECGSGLQVRAEYRRPQQTGYGCVKPGCRKVQRNAVHLDEYVITRTLLKLNDEDSPPGELPAAPELAGQFAALTRRLEGVEEAIADPDSEDLELLRRRRNAIRERLAQLRGQSAASASARLVRQHAGLTRQQWDDLPLGTRRALVAGLWSITVLPAGRRGPGFDPQRVRVVPV